MAKLSSFSKILILAGILIIPSVGYLLLSTGENQFRKLPILGPKQADSSVPGDTIYHSVSDFQLLTQDGDTLTRKEMAGKIVVANFFYATCQSICPKMAMQMKRVQEATQGDNSVMLISHSVNPEHDSVAVLEAYSREYGTTPGKWYLLTGDKKEIYDLARNSYFVTALPGDGGPEDFIHSEKLILVDKEGRLRGYYDGTDYEDVNHLLDEIKVLEWEYAQAEKFNAKP